MVGDDIFKMHGVYFKGERGEFGERLVNPRIRIEKDRCVLEIEEELPPPEVLHSILEIVGKRSQRDIITDLLDKENIEELLNGIREADRGIQVVEYSEETLGLKFEEGTLFLPLRSATAGNLGTILVRGDLPFDTIVLLLSLLDAITSIAEGMILTKRSTEMIRSSLRALYSAMQSRVREGEKIRELKERIYKKLRKRLGLFDEVYSLAFEIYDIGLIGVKDEILKKKYEEMSEEERKEYERHPIYGYEILRNISGLPKELLDATLYHHERMDGSGFPNHVTGSEIPEIAYVIGLTDEASLRLLEGGSKEEILEQIKKKFPKELIVILKEVL